MVISVVVVTAPFCAWQAGRQAPGKVGGGTGLQNNDQKVRGHQRQDLFKLPNASRVQHTQQNRRAALAAPAVASRSAACICLHLA